ELTDRYTRPRAADLDAAADALPSFRPVANGVGVTPCPPPDAGGAVPGSEIGASGATDSESSTQRCRPSGVAGQELATGRQEVLTGNHNPRAGGSSPSAAIHDRRRQFPPKPV